MTNADGSGATGPGLFVYFGPAPTVTSVSPNSGPTTGGTAVTITGTDFVKGSRVTFDAISATSVRVVSSTTITAVTPAHPADGAVEVIVFSPANQSGPLSNAFTYVLASAPTVSGVSPSSGPREGGAAITITGTNFAPGAKVTMDGVDTYVSSVTSTSISAITPGRMTVGVVDLIVTNTDGRASTAVQYTYVQSPRLQSLNVGSGPGTGGTTVTLTGSNFDATATVTFGSALATVTGRTGSTQIVVTTPGACAASEVVVFVTNGTGLTSNSLPFVFTPVVPGAPAITGYTAASAQLSIDFTPSGVRRRGAHHQLRLLDGQRNHLEGRPPRAFCHRWSSQPSAGPVPPL